MCGRYTIRTDRRKLQERFSVDELPEFTPRYNLGPTQEGLVVRTGSDSRRREAAWLRWGLVPSWTKRRETLPLMINARAETLASKSAFREPFKRRRCLVLADGFYEWSRNGAIKQAYHFTVDRGEPFAMAGLWDRWQPEGAPDSEGVESFAIITTVANEILAPHHDRMPVILERDWQVDWLNPLLTDTEVLGRLLQPLPALRMVGRAVSVRVNSIQHDDPGCLEPPEGAVSALKAPRPAHAGDQMDLGID